MILTLFRDRIQAGQSLAAELERFAGKSDVVVLGLPRGGVPVAYEIAKVLRAPLDVFVVGKLGFPDQPELALGAVTSGGVRFFNQELLHRSDLSPEDLEGIAKRKIRELKAKEQTYRQGRPAAPLEGRTVILVDDGAATGASMRAALQALRGARPKRLVAAVPVASHEGLAAIRPEADETYCPLTPDSFRAVGQWYEDFQQITDAEVVRCLEDFHSPAPISIPLGNVELYADLDLPPNAHALILFAHGSGSGRLSPRNRQVARSLHDAGFATLLLDLLTRVEERIDKETSEFRFNIELLTERLVAATLWAAQDPRLAQLRVGYFGASTGAAAALMAAARLQDMIGAVVSRGGRPDLAGKFLSGVLAPTLLLVGEKDDAVLALNEHAMESMRCVVKLEVVPGATHLFEEAGALERVSQSAAEWFSAHLAKK